MATRLDWTRARLEQIRVKRDNLGLHGFLGVSRSGLKGRITLTIARNIEPPPGIIGRGASRFNLARERPPVLFEFETSDHRYSSRVSRKVLRNAR
ncbi:MAG: hypothetical protein ABIT20_17460 [Gemmatimonadaceae bacterium]